MIWFAIAAAAPEVISSTVDEGRLAQRITDAPADLVIFYGSEQDGALGTCGCPGDPRGSLGRVHGYVDAVRATGTPLVLINAGNWLTDPIGNDNRLRADAFVRNEHMVDAMGGWDALNISFRDLPYLGQDGHFPSAAVSANIGEGPARYRIIEAGGQRIAITGVTAWKKLYLQPEGYPRLDPVQALEDLLPELRKQADLVVVTSYGLGSRNRALAALDIDVLIDADTHRNRSDAFVESGTVWVRSRFGTQFLGELRLNLGEHGIRTAHDRAISLDKKIPTAPGWKRREKAAARALEKASN